MTSPGGGRLLGGRHRTYAHIFAAVSQNVLDTVESTVSAELCDVS